MRSSLLMVVPLSALVAGCVTERHELRISPEDARFVSIRPVIGVVQAPAPRAEVEVKTRDLLEVVTAVATAVQTQPLSKPMVPSGMVPELTANWSRPAVPPEQGPLFDPTDVMAAAVLGELQRGQLADPASRVCLTPEECQTVGAVLDVQITEMDFSNGQVAMTPRMRAFRAHAVLRTQQGRMLWQGFCGADGREITRSLPPRPTSAEYLQTLLDRGAWECGAQLVNHLATDLNDSLAYAGPAVPPGPPAAPMQQGTPAPSGPPAAATEPAPAPAP